MLNFKLEDYAVLPEDMLPYQKFLFDTYQFAAGYLLPTQEWPFYQITIVAFLPIKDSDRVSPKTWGDNQLKTLEEVQDFYNEAVMSLLTHKSNE